MVSSCRLVLVVMVLLFFIAQTSSSSADHGEVQEHQNWMARGANRRLLPTDLPVDCDEKCKERCGLHSRPNVCTRACGTCCKRCNCVPPGTSGNRELCGSCYTDMTTHGNRTKCP